MWLRLLFPPLLLAKAYWNYIYFASFKASMLRSCTLWFSKVLFARGRTLASSSLKEIRDRLMFGSRF